MVETKVKQGRKKINLIILEDILKCRFFCYLGYCALGLFPNVIAFLLTIVFKNCHGVYIFKTSYTIRDVKTYLFISLKTIWNLFLFGIFSPERSCWFNVFCVHDNQHNVFDKIGVKDDDVKDERHKKLDPDELRISLDQGEDQPVFRVENHHWEVAAVVFAEGFAQAPVQARVVAAQIVNHFGSWVRALWLF